MAFAGQAVGHMLLTWISGAAKPRINGRGHELMPLLQKFGFQSLVEISTSKVHVYIQGLHSHGPVYRQGREAKAQFGLDI